MDHKMKPAGWHLWLLWVLATAFGLLTGAALNFRLGGLAFVRTRAAFDLGPVLTGALFGTGVGIPQWLVLRRWIFKSGWWAPATVAGFMLGAAGNQAVTWAAWQIAGLGLNHPGLDLLDSVLSGAVIGAGIGLAQWLVLRRRFAWSGSWVLANSAGSSFTIALVAIARSFVIDPGGMELPTFENPGLILAFLILALFAGGMVTGIALVWLARQPFQDP